MRMQEKTKEWLTAEKITIEYNPLLTTVPANVGFLYNVCPREDTTILHQVRLENILETKYGVYKNFQLSKQVLFADGHRNRCFIMMVKSDKEDISEINEALEDLNESTSIKYLSWIEYMALNIPQKLFLINGQTAYMAANRSLTIPGFCDDDDDIPMIYHENDGMNENEDNPTQDPLETVGVTDYLSHHIKTGKGKMMFSFVYPPIKGVREVLVFHEHVTEALAFIKCCPGELARKMNKLAIEHVFKDPEEATRQAAKKAWQPFRNTSKIPECVTAPLMENPRTKRLRYDHPKRTTYAAVTKNNYHHQSTRSVITTSSATASINTNITDDTIHKQKTDKLESLLSIMAKKHDDFEAYVKDNMSKGTDINTIKDLVKESMGVAVKEIETKRALEPCPTANGTPINGITQDNLDELEEKMKADMAATINKAVQDNNINITNSLNNQFSTAMTKITSEHNEQMRQVAETNEADRAATAKMFRDIMNMGEQQKARDYERERLTAQSKAEEQVTRAERDRLRNIEKHHMHEKEMQRDKDLEFLKDSVNILMYNKENESDASEERNESFASLNDMVQDAEPMMDTNDYQATNANSPTELIYASEEIVGTRE